MSHPLEQVVARAIGDVSTGRGRGRRGDEPGWHALGIDADLLADAARHALDEKDAADMRREAVRRRLDVLLAGGSRIPPRQTLDLSGDVRAAIARTYALDRLAVMRCRRAFVDRGPPMRPVVVDAVRRTGVDVAALAMIAAAYDHTVQVQVADGLVAAKPRRAEPILHDSPLEEMNAGVPLGRGLRLSVARDGNLWLVVPGLPDAVTGQFKGRRLGEIVTHPSLPADALVTGVHDIGEVDPEPSAPDNVLVAFEHEGPRTWRGEDPDRFGPMRS